MLLIGAAEYEPITHKLICIDHAVPFGRETPFAIPLGRFRRLMEYAIETGFRSSRFRYSCWARLIHIQIDTVAGMSLSLSVQSGNDINAKNPVQCEGLNRLVLRAILT